MAENRETEESREKEEAAEPAPDEAADTGNSADSRTEPLLAGSEPRNSGPSVIEAMDDYAIDLLLLDAGLTHTFSSQRSLLDSERSQRERLRQVEDLVSQCMKAEGFDYYARPVENLVVAAVDPEFEYGTREWVANYGLWISTSIVQSHHDLPEGIVGDGSVKLDSPDLDEDPNELYRAELDEPTQLAYEETLNGTDGCRVQVQQQVPLDSAAPVRFDLGRHDSLDERVLADPAYIAYEAELVACLGENGVERFASVAEAEDHFISEAQRRLLDDTELVYESTEWFDVLRELQVEERRFALTHFDCGGSPVRRVEVMREILSRLEVSR